jgi:hypothetical protein
LPSEGGVGRGPGIESLIPGINVPDDEVVTGAVVTGAGVTVVSVRVVSVGVCAPAIAGSIANPAAVASILSFIISSIRVSCMSVGRSMQLQGAGPSGKKLLSLNRD